MTTVAVVPETALLDTRERLVVSPSFGRLRLLAPTNVTTEGEVVRSGAVLAVVDADGTSIEVCAPCDAWVMNFLMLDGQRVEPGSAIAHLRAL